MVTCGPGLEPIDSVRRITNFSTGRLGVQLANYLSARGWDVTCFVGEGATYRTWSDTVQIEFFTTNDSLLDALRRRAACEEPCHALFHAAALCDWTIDRVTHESGLEAVGGKIESRSGNLTLHLQPAMKILPLLRDLFPKTWLAGWKYEVDGNRDTTLSRGERQFAECRTNACVVNGPAWGSGFGLLTPDQHLQECPGASELYEMLEEKALRHNTAQS